MQSTSARSGIARSVIFRRSGLRIVAPTRGRGIRAMESWDGINYAERIAADDICISECFGWERERERERAAQLQSILQLLECELQDRTRIVNQVDTHAGEKLIVFPIARDRKTRAASL